MVNAISEKQDQLARLCKQFGVKRFEVFGSAAGQGGFNSDSESSFMRPDVKKFLFDIQTAGLALQEFLEGKTFTDYAGSDFLRSAVERKLMIIGEAVSQIIHIDPELE
jgi:predicted nucleotidyltransferase